METKSFIVPANTLDALFYGDYTKLTPQRVQALDNFLDGLKGVKSKVPSDYQNIGHQDKNNIDKKACNCYRITFDLI